MLFAGCLSGVVGSLGQWTIDISYSSNPYEFASAAPWFRILVNIAVLAFIGGLLGGILALKRSYLPPVIAGGILNLILGVYVSLPPESATGYTLPIFAPLGTLEVVLSIAGIALAVRGRSNFTR